jgi:hypothetical protein
MWYFQSIEKGIRNQTEAANLCDTRGLRLPSGDDFRVAKQEGLVYATKPEMNSGDFWTATPPDIFRINKKTPLGTITSSEGVQKANVICIR